jgi:hypothetical protein
MIDAIIGERLRIRKEVRGCVVFPVRALWVECVWVLVLQREHDAAIIILRNYKKYVDAKVRKEAESKKAKGGKKKK